MLLQVITLSAPYVPVAPGEEWWNQQLVKRVRESMASESAVTGIDHLRADAELRSCLT